MIAIAKEEHRLAKLTTAGLKVEHETLFGEEIAGNNKTWILRRLQARAEGDLSERARRKAQELADDTHLRVVTPPEMRMPAAARTPKPDTRVPLPGTTISRLYKGTMVEVHVRDDGFEYAGEVHKTLSAAAKVVTGSHCNGFLFFNLTQHFKTTHSMGRLTLTSCSPLHSSSGISVRNAPATRSPPPGEGEVDRG